MYKVINLISGPRNLSTAIMYSFAQRDDCKVMDEPFYGHYLANVGWEVSHPSQEMILDSMELNREKVVDEINDAIKGNHLFVKGMAHHYLEDEPHYILDWENVILIRHPKKLIASFAKIINKPTLQDIGLKKAASLFTYLKDSGKTPIVIDSDELLKDPRNYLTQFCLLLKIPYTDQMLTWSQGGIPEDGIWAPHWYANVHRSEGFTVQKTSSRPLPEHLEPLLAEALPYYNTLKNHIVKNNPYASNFQP